MSVPHPVRTVGIESVSQITVIIRPVYVCQYVYAGLWFIRCCPERSVYATLHISSSPVGVGYVHLEYFRVIEVPIHGNTNTQVFKRLCVVLFESECAFWCIGVIPHIYCREVEFLLAWRLVLEVRTVELVTRETHGVCLHVRCVVYLLPAPSEVHVEWDVVVIVIQIVKVCLERPGFSPSSCRPATSGSYRLEACEVGVGRQIKHLAVTAQQCRSVVVILGGVHAHIIPVPWTPGIVPARSDVALIYPTPQFRSASHKRAAFILLGDVEEDARPAHLAAAVWFRYVRCRCYVVHPP